MILPLLFIGLCYSASPKRPDIPPLDIERARERKWIRLTDKQIADLLKLPIPKSKPIPIPNKPKPMPKPPWNISTKTSKK